MQYYAKLCKAVKFHWLTGMCGSKAASPRPQQGLGPAGEISGDHILSPHIEATHGVNVSIVLSSGAILFLLHNKTTVNWANELADTAVQFIFTRSHCYSL